MTVHEIEVVLLCLAGLLGLCAFGGMLCCRDMFTLKQRLDAQADEIKRFKGHGDRLARLELAVDERLLPSNPTVEQLYPLDDMPQTEWDAK